MRHREKNVGLTLDKFIISHAGQAFNSFVTDRRLQFFVIVLLYRI